MTLRIKVVGTFPSEPTIVVFWHGTMFPMWYLFKGKRSTAVVSKSKDGEILTRILQKWDIDTLRGSSNDGAKEVLNQIVEAAKNRYTLMTPDGPQGPRHKFKPGAVVAAMRSQVPLTYCNVKYSMKYRFKKSWDKFNLPLPFSKVTIDFSSSIPIPKSSSREEVNNFIKDIELKMSNI